MTDQTAQLDTNGDGVADTTAQVGGAYQPVSKYAAPDGGEWEVGMKLVKAPPPPKPPPPPTITISQPEVTVSSKRKTNAGPQVEWLGFPRRHVVATVVLLALVIGGGWFGWRVTVDEQTGAMQVIRDAQAAEAAKIRAQLEEQAAADRAQRAKDRAMIEALQARLAGLQKPAADAETRDDSTATTQPPPAGFESGQFHTWADARAFTIFIGALATPQEVTAVNSTVAIREAQHGEEWRVIDLRGTGKPAEDKPVGPPPGYVQITDAEYRTLKGCRELLARWAAQSGGSPWWRLKNDEREALRGAIGGQ